VPVEIVYKERKDFIEAVISYKIETVYGAITTIMIPQRGIRYDLRLSAFKDGCIHNCREVLWFARGPRDEQTARQDGQRKLEEVKKLLRKKGARARLVEGAIRGQEPFEIA
jgi:hypothetical protein